MTTKINTNQILGAIASVTTYGASASASAATNLAAINAALAANNSVSIPDGVFSVSAAITMNAGNRLLGPGTLSRATAGFLILADSVSDVVIDGVQFVGDKDSYAIHYKSVHQGVICNCHTDTINLCYVSAQDSDNANANATTISTNIQILNNSGLNTATVTTSIQWISLLFTTNFVVSGNKAKGFFTFCNTNGGDPNLYDGVGYERKCGPGVITGNTATTQGAGCWTQMSDSIAISDNSFTGPGTGSAEGIGAESSIRILLSNNVVGNYLIASYIRYLSREITFEGNIFQLAGGSDSYVFLNESAGVTPGDTFDADQGDISILNNRWQVTGGNLAQMITNNGRRFIIKGNSFLNAWPQVLFGSGIGEIIFTDNHVVSSAPPTSSPYAMYSLAGCAFGYIENGFTSTPVIPKITIKNNLIEYNAGGAMLASQGIGIVGNFVNTFIEITGNTILGFDNGIGLNDCGATPVVQTYIINNNIFSTACTNPLRLFKGGDWYAGMHVVLWQDNYRVSGVDCYAAAPSSAFDVQFNVGSRTWVQVPASAATPGYVCTVAGNPGTWKAMAVLA